MPRPARISRDQIAAAALAIADQDGLEAVSMRSVAAALGAGTMSLYNHVRNKADLERLVLEAATAPGTAAAPRGSWEARAKAVLRSIRSALERHPGVVPLLLKRPTTSEAALAPIEALLAALREGGFTGTALLRAYHVLFGFLTGFVLTDLTGTLATRRGRSVSEVAAAVAGLDPARFPNLTACAKLAGRAKPGEEFEYGLDAVLAGLRAVERL